MHAAGFSGDRAEHVCGKRDFEMGFAECGAAFADQEIHHFICGGFEFIGGAMEDFFAEGGGRIAPGGFCGVGGVDGGTHVLFLAMKILAKGF